MASDLFTRNLTQRGGYLFHVPLLQVGSGHGKRNPSASPWPKALSPSLRRCNDSDPSILEWRLTATAYKADGD